MKISRNTDTPLPMRRVLIKAHAIMGEETQITIAGGAVRDWLLMRQPNDYDVFVLSPNLEALCKFAIAFPKADNKAVGYMQHGSCFRVNLATYWCDVIFSPARNMQELLDAFDIGICQAGIFQGKLYRTDAFMQDMKEKIVRQRTFGAFQPAHSTSRVTALGLRLDWPTELLPVTKQPDPFDDFDFALAL